MPLVRIAALRSFLDTALSTTEAGTAYQLGAPSTGQKMYGVFHLTEGFASTARVIAPVIQSATASGFGAPVTRATFSRSTSPGAEWATPVENLSTEHTWWRTLATMSTAASTGGSWKGLIGMGFK